MLIELSVKNCFVFNNQIVFLLDPTNKEMAIYGPNNAGKTCLIKCIQAMKGILLNQRIEIKSNLFFKWLCLWVGYYIWIWEKYIIILFIVLDVRCDIFFENALIDFWVIIGIILLKVAIPLDVVSIHKSCGRMRDGKHSCLFTHSTTERKVVVGWETLNVHV